MLFQENVKHVFFLYFGKKTIYIFSNTGAIYSKPRDPVFCRLLYPEIRYAKVRFSISFDFSEYFDFGYRNSTS